MTEKPQPAPPGRLLNRDGRVGLVTLGLERDLIRDLYHSLMDASWPLLLFLLAALYVLANCAFAAAYVLQDGSIENARPGSFADAFFFSVQTMATVGYGKMVPATLFAEILAASESFVGLLGLALVTGLVFSKFSRPTARVMFSRVAVVTHRDGIPSLMFRMANQRRNQIVDARVHVVVARNEITAEGESIRRVRDVAMMRAQNPLFILSWTAIHQITESSPFFGASAETLVASETEVIVSVTGLDGTFSQTVHARYSYGGEDILWGARFADILLREPDGRRVIDYHRFHDVEKD